jgi:hypothetical protein
MTDFVDPLSWPTLDEMGILLGVSRKDQEPDDDYRIRMLTIIVGRPTRQMGEDDAAFRKRMLESIKEPK